MDNNKKYNIEDFYVGELYLYSNFANFTSRLYNPENQEKINIFTHTDAINFQQEPLSKYIDWETGREYTGFLTLFYKQGNSYICLHDGNIYRLKGIIRIDNLIPLNNLLPQINSKIPTTISIQKALQLFNILFKENQEEIQLYNDNKENISNFYIGEITLDETIISDNGYKYPRLKEQLILKKQSLLTRSTEEYNIIKNTYRCLFLKQELNYYNINNNQFYNPCEHIFNSLISLQEELNSLNIHYSHQTLSIPKALYLSRRKN